MRKAVLFIISVFVFGACMPKATVKEFEDFVDAYKQVQEKNNAEAMGHVRLTKEAQDDIVSLKKQLKDLMASIGYVIFKIRKLDINTNLNFYILIKALEDRGIRLDLKKVWERMQREEIEKKLKEKSK